MRHIREAPMREIFQKVTNPRFIIAHEAKAVSEWLATNVSLSTVSLDKRLGLQTNTATVAFLQYMSNLRGREIGYAYIVRSVVICSEISDSIIGQTLKELLLPLLI